MKVVDTTVLVDHARGTAAVAGFLPEQSDEMLVVWTISLQALAFGEVTARTKTLAAIRGNLRAFDIRA